MSSPTMRSLVGLAVAALAVVTLGMVTIYSTKVGTTELLVGSYPIARGYGHPHPPAGYGNQAMGSVPSTAGFYNQAHAKRQALLVGSYNANQPGGAPQP
eukprot:CAMPEP_0181323270 /NCGR_PEP_ID=MMETSP1101-20121128/19689_1 /TAXON_ID=46948 /ORGANISM="Rhodomonas abbreviata, Strain Caron Lab Isolate" /LENGTH=98 /DNA_ID=CAMNT_0023431273 /DNA_START=9 /DNA_END=301 /DNA_ORIENTATION=-